jgi:pimeloyl-ACP methyl ester carboxylesterase
MSSALATVERRRELVRSSPADPCRYVATYAPRATTPRASVVLCPPLGEEQSRARSALHRVAARLARTGHQVATYDPTAHGDSEGDGAELTMAALERDLVTVARVASADVVVAFRFGALVAAIAAASGRLAARRLVLVSPVLRGDTYARDLLRASVAERGVAGPRLHEVESALFTGGVVEIAGHAFGAELFRGMLATDAISALASASDVSTDLICIRQRPPAAPPPERAELLRRCPGIRSREVEAPAFWRDDGRRVITDLPSLADEIGDVLREER